MPRLSNYPITYEDCKSIEIKILKKNNYLQSNQLNECIIRWYINEETTGKMKLIVNTLSANPYIELIYTLNEEGIQYKVQLIKEKSNLGIGEIWYFICPFTNKRCRKLYLLNKYFSHRNRFKGVFYEKQLLSKSNRKILGLFNKVNHINDAIEETNSKHFRRYYNKAKTKRLIKLRKIINQEIDIKEINYIKNYGNL
jgi:hypothetical protein